MVQFHLVLSRGIKWLHPAQCVQNSAAQWHVLSSSDCYSNAFPLSQSRCSDGAPSSQDKVYRRWNKPLILLSVFFCLLLLVSGALVAPLFVLSLFKLAWMFCCNILHVLAYGLYLLCVKNNEPSRWQIQTIPWLAYLLSSLQL